MKSPYAIKEGDWVTVDSRGIWLVAKIVSGMQRIRYSLADDKRREKSRTLICKQFVGKAWKPEYRVRAVDELSVTRLPDDLEEQLHEFITSNIQLFQEFEGYQGETMSFVLNYRLLVPDTVEMQALGQTIMTTFEDIQHCGLMNDEILSRIEKSGLERYVATGMCNAVLQFTCRDYEARQNEYVFRDVKLFKT